MKKLMTILLLLGLVAAIGYILGTEAGRARRDELLVRLRGAAGGSDTAATDTTVDLTIDATETTDTAGLEEPTGAPVPATG